MHASIAIQVLPEAENEQELCRIQLETGAFYTGDSRESDELLDSIERYPEKE